MNSYEEMVSEMSKMVLRIEELREALIKSSPLEAERDEYRDLVEKVQFLMEELVVFEEDESF